MTRISTKTSNNHQTNRCNSIQLNSDHLHEQMNRFKINQINLYNSIQLDNDRLNRKINQSI